MSTCHLTTKLQGVKFKQPQSLGVYFAIYPKKNLKDLRKANLNLLANNNNFTQTQYSTSH